MIKKYFSGVRMLEDLQSGKISLAEKVLYLIMIYASVSESVEKLLSNVEIEQVANGLTANALTVVWILIFSFINRWIDGRELIERFVCLNVTATLTAYVVLVPAMLFFKFFYHIYFKSKLSEDAFDWIIMLYIPIFVTGSLYFWGKRLESRRALHSPP